MSGSLLLNETCKFKLEPSLEQKLVLEELIETYRLIVECLDVALKLGVTSRKKLHEAVYKKLR